jgi:hypothetical protein
MVVAGSFLSLAGGVLGLRMYQGEAGLPQPEAAQAANVPVPPPDAKVAEVAAQPPKVESNPLMPPPPAPVVETPKDIAPPPTPVAEAPKPVVPLPTNSPIMEAPVDGPKPVTAPVDPPKLLDSPPPEMPKSEEKPKPVEPLAPTPDFKAADGPKPPDPAPTDAPKPLDPPLPAVEMPKSEEKPKPVEPLPPMPDFKAADAPKPPDPSPTDAPKSIDLSVAPPVVPLPGPGAVPVPVPVPVPLPTGGDGPKPIDAPKPADAPPPAPPTMVEPVKPVDPPKPVETPPVGSAALTSEPVEPRPLPDMVQPAAVKPTALPPPPKPTVSDSFLEEEYRLRGGDTFAAVSRRFYFTEKYGEALRLYNRDYPIASSDLRQDPPRMTPGAQVWIPPIRVLEKRYPAAIPGLQAAPAAPAAAQGAGPNWSPAQVQPASSTPKTYRVAAGGESLQDIARKTLGRPQNWGEIYQMNPQLSANPALPIPAGTLLRLPATARVD